MWEERPQVLIGGSDLDRIGVGWFETEQVRCVIRRRFFVRPQEDSGRQDSGLPVYEDQTGL